MSLADDRFLFVSNEGGRYAVYAGDPDAPGEGASFVRLTEAAYASAAAYEPQSGRLYYRGLHPDGYALFDQAADPSGAGREPTPFETPPAESEPASAEVEVQGPLRRGGYADNLLTLFPRLLAPQLSLDFAGGRYLAGLAAYGTSALGDIRYYAGGLIDVLTGAPAAQGGLWLLLPPFAFSFLGSSLDSGWLEATVEATVLRRLAPLGRSLTLGLTAFLSGAGLADKQYEPFAGFGLAGPLDELSGRIGALLQRLELGSRDNRVALLGQLSLTHAFPFGAAVLSLLALHDLQGQPWRLPAPRGYQAGLAAVSGLSLDLDFPFRLLRIRKGFWNPPLYVQDLYLSPFAAAATNELLEWQLAAGAELHWEIKAFAAYTGWPADLVLRLAVNREGMFSVGVLFVVVELTEGIWPDYRRRIR